MTKESIYTVELNLNDDFANSCAYHVDDLMTTIKRNIKHAETAQKPDLWVLVGLAHSLGEAMEKAEKLQVLLCERNNKTPYGLEKLLQGMAENQG